MILELETAKISRESLSILSTPISEKILDILNNLGSTQIRSRVVSNITFSDLTEVCISFSYYDYPFNLYLYKEERFQAILFYTNKSITITDMTKFKTTLEHIKLTAEKFFEEIQNLVQSN